MATYATTDWHGIYALYEKTKAILQPEDRVIFLGDANDRGKDGYKLMKAIYNNPQFTYLRANHEDMFVRTARKYNSEAKIQSFEVQEYLQEGGRNTLADWCADGYPKDFLDKLDSLPTHIEYLNKNGLLVLLSHSGYTPRIDVDESLIIPNDSDLIKNRKHFYDDDYENWLPNSVVVHGHTTILQLAEYLCDPRDEIPSEPYWYDNNRKVCLDLLSHETGEAVLLNLDTFEYILLET